MVNNLKLIPKDEIFSLKKNFDLDPRPNKINGGVGVYLDDQGEAFVLPVVKKASAKLDLSNFNYFPIAGDKVFLSETLKLFLGKTLFDSLNRKISSQGVAGGTNGLFTWGLLMKQKYTNPKIIISQPTWENHKQIFSYLGFKLIEYPHLDSLQQFNYSAFKNCLINTPRSCLLIHAGSTHNPTGVNPSNTQWQEIARIIKKNQHEILFDASYIGLGKNISVDTYAMRLFAKKNISYSSVISFSKNLTLYQHRCGVLFTIANSAKEKEILENHYQHIFRISNSNPPAFGELIAKNIFSNPHLKTSWIKSLKKIVKSIHLRRCLFVKYVGAKYAFITRQSGFYSLLGLTPKQIEDLRIKHGIYLLSNSRINFGGLPISKISTLAKAIKAVS